MEGENATSHAKLYAIEVSAVILGHAADVGMTPSSYICVQALGKPKLARFAVSVLIRMNCVGAMERSTRPECMNQLVVIHATHPNFGYYGLVRFRKRAAPLSYSSRAIFRPNSRG